MILDFKVKRERYSATQGNATVYLNGEKILTLADEIKLIKDGENIDGWASITPDNDFINSVLFHPLDSVYYYSDKIIKEIIKKQGNDND